MNEVIQFLNEYGLYPRTKPSNFNAHFARLKKSFLLSDMSINGVPDPKEILQTFYFYFGGLYVENWSIPLSFLNIKEDKKIVEIFESINILYDHKNSKFVSSFNFQKLFDNKVNELVLDKEILKNISTSLHLKSLFLTEIEVRLATVNEIEKTVDDYLEISGFNKRFPGTLINYLSK